MSPSLGTSSKLKWLLEVSQQGRRLSFFMVVMRRAMLLLGKLLFYMTDIGAPKSCCALEWEAALESGLACQRKTIVYLMKL